MRDNIIYIKPDEEITSVVDRVIKFQPQEIFLVIPANAVISQSMVNLKLLKREADNLRKIITIVTPEVSLQRLAKKIDFAVASGLQELEKQTVEEPILEQQVSESKFEDFLKHEKRPGSISMADIMQTSQAPKQKAGIKEEEPAYLKNEEIVAAKQEITEQKEKEIPIKIYDRHVPEIIQVSSQPKGSVTRETFVPSFSIKIFGIFVGAAIVVAALVFLLILPKADIKIVPKTEKVVIDLKVTASQDASKVDSGLNLIPAQMVKIEERNNLEFAATGERQLNEKAKGKITVYNAYSSSPQALVETTRFMTEDEKIFRLINTVTIPGAKIEEGKIVPSSLEVDVEADQPGADYNIGPSKFTIPGFKGSPKYNGFYGRSTEPMTGGSTEKAKVISQEDLDEAKKTALEAMKNQAQEQIAGQISEGYDFLPEAIVFESTELKPSAEVGSKAEKFTLDSKIIAKTLIFSEADINELLNKNLFGGLGGKKEVSSDTSFSYNEVKPDMAKGNVTFKVQGEKEVVWQVSEKEIEDIVLGKSQEEVAEIFSQRTEIEKAQVSLWPFWLKSIPKEASRVKITVEGQP